MGYTTQFRGAFSVSPPLSHALASKINNLGQARDMEKNSRWNGEEADLDYPDSYNQWEVSDDGASIAWDGGEKFYCYVEWIKYIADLLKKNGHVLNGKVHWRGEDFDDIGTIEVVNNKVTAVRGYWH